jgi:uncharacterized protein DUF3309
MWRGCGGRSRLFFLRQFGESGRNCTEERAPPPRRVRELPRAAGMTVAHGESGAGATLGRAPTRPSFQLSGGDRKMLSTILLIVLVLLLIGALPAWPYSRSWGYAPTGGLGLVVVVLLVLVVMGRI